MYAIPKRSSKSDWNSDQLDSPTPPEIKKAYFDPVLDAWVLSRHQDVLSAFRSSKLVPIGANSKKTPGPQQERALLALREETLAALSPTQLRAWHDGMAPMIQDAINHLPEDHPIDLLSDYADPLCLAFASIVTGTDPQYGKHLYQIAQAVSAAAAEPFDPLLRNKSKTDGAKLRCHFHSGYETLRESGFVAIAHTMPCLLGNAWYALLRNPRQWRRLHQDSSLVEAGIEELLRFAGLTRILFRSATEDMTLGEIRIRRGERLILRIVAANRDPGHFAEANQLDITRRSMGHLALGAGPHSCVGASLIRMIAKAMTAPLVERFSHATLHEPVAWKGGSGFRSPVSLPVLFKRTAIET